MNSIEIIRSFYPEDTEQRRLLMLHSSQVRDKALQIIASPACKDLNIDLQIVNDGALLHDIGILQCHAPSIHCEGDKDYLLHGVIGARMLREYGQANGINMEPYARICERHTGAGLTADDIRRQHLPMTIQDYLPETLEEKLVCLADKFFSKSSPNKEKSMERIETSMLKFGNDTLLRFKELCKIFGLNN